MTAPPPPAPGQQEQTAPQPNAGQQQASQGLPPTGLQQQMQSLNDFYAKVGAAQTPDNGSLINSGNSIGFNVRQFQATRAFSEDANLGEDVEIGSNSLDQMARNLATRYGMPIGRGRLVDEYGNFLLTPEQIADASGGQVTLGEAATQMNYISQAIARRQNEQQQQKGIATLQAGMGQIQSRGRGSAAAMMSGYYQDIADMYANQQYEAADFSYYIQKEQQMIQDELERRARKRARKQGRVNVIAGIALTVASLYSGNITGAAAGVGMVSQGAADSGWF